MLIQLTVQNYAIVEHLDLDLSQGMSAITGETGAGKSIMLDALSLTLGARAESSVVRPGSDKADILSSFDLQAIPEASQWLQSRDLDNDGLCLLRRIITKEGRSRGYINGTPCTQSDLKELGAMLIDVHSQHEHQSLLKTDTHRRLLDEFATLTPLAEQAAQLAKLWREKSSQLARLSQNSEEQQSRIQLLSYQLEELNVLALGEGELAQLEQEQQTLTQATGLIEYARFVIDSCSENDDISVLGMLAGCLNRSRAFTRLPTSLAQSNELLASAQIQIEEAVGELNRFLDGFDCDPQRQLQVEERLDSIYSLARKHKIPPEQLHDLQQQLLQELESLQGDDSQLDSLAQEISLCEKQYQQIAGKLSKARASAGKKLEQSVSERMQGLDMPGGRFAVELQPFNDARPNPQGLEGIEFLVSANPGQPLKSLAKVASGGELSRISLAIQVITAQTSRVPTLVFDEVDVGIGGPTAEIVGQLLRQLGHSGQVIAVTHLPQVAAQAHQHLFVYKERGKNSTSTALKVLNDSERTEEIARMLGGINRTEESLAHAKQMLTTALQKLA